MIDHIALKDPFFLIHFWNRMQFVDQMLSLLREDLLELISFLNEFYGTTFFFFRVSDAISGFGRLFSGWVDSWFRGSLDRIWIRMIRNGSGLCFQLNILNLIILKVIAWLLVSMPFFIYYFYILSMKWCFLTLSPYFFLSSFYAAGIWFLKFLGLDFEFWIGWFDPFWYSWHVLPRRSECFWWFILSVYVRGFC